MHFEDAEVMTLIAKGITALERSARASEKLLEIAEKEQVEFDMEPGPPICPVCGQMNPTVIVQEQGGAGPLSGYVVELQTTCCTTTLYAIPEGWVMTPSRDEALAYVTERAENVRDNSNGGSVLNSTRGDQEAKQVAEDEARAGRA